MRLLVHACAALAIAHGLVYRGRECVLRQTTFVFDELRKEEFDKAKTAAIEDERVLGLVPTTGASTMERLLGLVPDVPPAGQYKERLLVARYIARLNLRGYHNNRGYKSLFDAYLETAWWFEIHSFAEKLLLNGVAMFITQQAAQITFGVLVSAMLLVVQVHVNPFAERSIGVLANLLSVATFLLLLIGAHVALVGDGEWTTDIAGVQFAITLCAGVCILIAMIIVGWDACFYVIRMRAAHTKKWERKQRKLRADARVSRGAPVRAVVVDAAPTSPSPLSPGRLAVHLSRSSPVSPLHGDTSTWHHAESKPARQSHSCCWPSWS